jgi:hypothetical protein
VVASAVEERGGRLVEERVYGDAPERAEWLPDAVRTAPGELEGSIVCLDGWTW